MPPESARPIASSLDYAALFEASPYPCMVLDRELRYVAANAAYLSATGSRREDLIDRHVFELFPHDPNDPDNTSAQTARAALLRVLATGRPEEVALLPYRIARTPDGPREERLWSNTYVPLRDAEGTVVGVIGYALDVTDLARPGGVAKPALGAAVLQRAARVHDAWTEAVDEVLDLRRLFEQAPGVMAYLRGPSHVLELANDACLELVGKRDVLGLTLREAFPELEGQGFIAALDDVFASGKAFVGSGVRVAFARGPDEVDEHIVDFVFQPIARGEGGVVGIFVQAIDHTEEARAQRENQRLELVRSELDEERRFLAESIPQQVWTARPDGTLDFVNRHVVDYFGVSREAILGAGWQEMIHPDDLGPCLEAWSTALATGDPYQIEFRLRGQSGQYRWYLGRALAQRDRSGRVLKWFGTNTDIDDAKRSQEALRARIEYEEQLIGIVSHDLRNPLNAIGVGATLLSEGALDVASEKAVSLMVSGTKRAARLIDDLLDFAQARGEGIPIRPAPTKLRALVQQVADELELGAPARRIDTVHEGEETGEWDDARLSQAVGNLMGNALQHGQAAEKVRVRTRIEGDLATIEVHNVGAVIPDGDRARLFEPFTRGASTSGSRGRSVGLGLYIARVIVRAHGGDLTVESSTATGTTFRVTLPRKTPRPSVG